MPRMNDLYRTCKDCGETFRGGAKASYCEDCRNIRKQESYIKTKARIAEGTARKKGNEYVCISCGNTYILNGGKQKRCSSCAKLKIIEDAKRNYEEYKAGISERGKAARMNAHKICVVCGKEFEKIYAYRICSPECAKIRADVHNSRRKAKKKKEAEWRTRAPGSTPLSSIN